MSKLNGKVAVITGANSGIGLATAKLFVQEGAKVVITGRRQEAIEEAANTLEGEVLAITADAGNLADNQRVISETVNKFGKIDILFLNAGIAPFSPVASTGEDLFDETIKTNLKGPFFTVKEAIPHLSSNAAIIFNTTIAHTKGFPNMGAYVASKAGLRSLARVLSNELSEKGIRVLSVSPGPIETPLYGKLGLPEEQVKSLGEQFAAQVPLGRFGNAEEIARTVLFLASEDASFINAVELQVDGGLSQV